MSVYCHGCQDYIYDPELEQITAQVSDSVLKSQLGLKGLFSDPCFALRSELFVGLGHDADLSAAAPLVKSETSSPAKQGSSFVVCRPHFSHCSLDHLSPLPSSLTHSPPCTHSGAAWHVQSWQYVLHELGDAVARKQPAAETSFGYQFSFVSLCRCCCFCCCGWLRCVLFGCSVFGCFVVVAMDIIEATASRHYPTALYCVRSR